MDAVSTVPEYSSRVVFPHFMCDENGRLKQENGQPVYADNGGSSEEVEKEQTILVNFFATGEIPSEHFLREGGSFKRDTSGGLIYADNGGTAEEISAEKAMIEFLLKQSTATKIESTPAKTQNWFRRMVDSALNRKAA